MARQIALLHCTYFSRSWVQIHSYAGAATDSISAEKKALEVEKSTMEAKLRNLRPGTAEHTRIGKLLQTNALMRLELLKQRTLRIQQQATAEGEAPGALVGLGCSGDRAGCGAPRMAGAWQG